LQWLFSFHSSANQNLDLDPDPNSYPDFDPFQMQWLFLSEKLFVGSGCFPNIF
jgi:hypothetical protein